MIIVQIDLLETVKRLLFDSVAALLFGEAFLEAHGCGKLRAAFFDFEEEFELAASPLPHALQPRFCRARSTLLAAFRRDLLLVKASTMMLPHCRSLWLCQVVPRTSYRLRCSRVGSLCCRLAGDATCSCSPLTTLPTRLKHITSNAARSGPYSLDLSACAAGRQLRRATCTAPSWASCWRSATSSTARRRTCCWRCCGRPWCGAL